MEDVIAPWSPRRQRDVRSELQRMTEAFEDESPLCEIPPRIEHDPLSPIPKKLVDSKYPSKVLIPRLGCSVYRRTEINSFRAE